MPSDPLSTTSKDDPSCDPKTLGNTIFLPRLNRQTSPSPRRTRRRPSLPVRPASGNGFYSIPPTSSSAWRPSCMFSRPSSAESRPLYTDPQALNRPALSPQQPSRKKGRTFRQPLGRSQRRKQSIALCHRLANVCHGLCQCLPLGVSFFSVWHARTVPICTGVILATVLQQIRTVLFSSTGLSFFKKPGTRFRRLRSFLAQRYREW